MKLSAGPITYLITRGEADPKDPRSAFTSILSTIRDSVVDGIDLVQIREKRLTGKQLFELTQEASRLTQGTRTRIIVNDRVDIALSAGADGVHLTENSVPASIVRAHVSSSFLIAVSVHSLEGARAAVDGGADLGVLGPVFNTPGKPPQGIEAFRRVCGALQPFPLLAIGGIDESNFQDALLAGARGLAAIRSLNDRASRRSIISSLRRQEVKGR